MNLRFLYLISALFCVCNFCLADDTNYFEVRGDRTIIYPQRMELDDEVSLMDVLEMYPELLICGYDDVLRNYQLRMDNVIMSADRRQLLTQIKAKNLKLVQIVDNPGVAKGTTDMVGVIDITLMPMEKGAHGFAETRFETKGSISPTVNLIYGGKNTDLWVNTNYGYSDFESAKTHQEYVDAQGITNFGERDRLLTYFKQEYGNVETSSSLDIKRNYLARARYFHTFNDMGTELLTLLSYQYTDTPHYLPAYRNKINTQIPMYLFELNTPLFTRDLTMMLGAEGEYNIIRYGVREGKTFDEESRYDFFNQDFYLQLNYNVGRFLFTLGDRIMLYYYDMDGYSGKWLDNETRNMFQASVAYRPHDGHQVQLGYYRKFINPAYIDIFPESWPNADGTTWHTGNPLLCEEKVEQVKLGYVFLKNNLSLYLNENYFNMESKNIWRTDASLYYKYKKLQMTAGVNVNNEKYNNYYCVRFAPKASLPYKIQLAANMIYNSDNAPYKQITGTSVYGELSANKQFNNHWHAQLLWHDIFAKRYSSLMVSVKYNY